MILEMTAIVHEPPLAPPEYRGEGHATGPEYRGRPCDSPSEYRGGGHATVLSIPPLYSGG